MHYYYYGTVVAIIMTCVIVIITHTPYKVTHYSRDIEETDNQEGGKQRYVMPHVA